MKRTLDPHTLQEQVVTALWPLGPEPIDREQAIRNAAQWAREQLGLEFSRLRADGHIADGLRSAITSAIRRGEIIGHAKRISRPA